MVFLLRFLQRFAIKIAALNFKETQIKSLFILKKGTDKEQYPDHSKKKDTGNLSC